MRMYLFVNVWLTNAGYMWQKRICNVLSCQICRLSCVLQCSNFLSYRAVIPACFGYILATDSHELTREKYA